MTKNCCRVDIRYDTIPWNKMLSKLLNAYRLHKKSDLLRRVSEILPGTLQNR
jgi:hypothetical protein